MTRARQRALVTAYIAAYNAGDIVGMLALLDDDITFRNVSQGVVTHETCGLDAFRALAQQSAALFSERHQEIVALDGGGDEPVVATIRFRAVFAQDVPEGPAAGETVALSGRSAFRFRGDRIAAIRDDS